MVVQTPIQVVIVDDHAMLRRGLAVFLASYSDLKLVCEAANGQEAVTLCAEKRPNVVLMDLMMPVMDGITATRLIRRDYPETQIIALTSFGEESLIKEILEAGAISYLFKKVSADDLVVAIRAAQAGLSTFAPEAIEILVRSAQQPDVALQKLTRRENEVLTLMIKGLANNQIALQLAISLATTKSHVSKILAKLGLESRSEVIALMLEHDTNLRALYIK